MKFIRVLKAYNYEKVKPIFDKELDELLNIINNELKSQGVDIYYYCPNKTINFSDGYYVSVKLKIGDRDTIKDEIWKYSLNLEDLDTKNLIFKSSMQTGHGASIYLKDNYRETSHRGQHPNIDTWTDEDWMKTGQ